MTAIIGTGLTGLSVARFLQSQGQPFVFFDTRGTPPNALKISQKFPNVRCQFGDWDADILLNVDEIIISPGVSLATPAIAQAIKNKVPVLGDVALFLRFTVAPIVAITGSNGKSTVTTWVGDMAKAAGIDVAVGGNLGTPVLELLNKSVSLYILELSSFQLETISRLNAHVACILNISEDHFDRYSGMPEYHAVKQKVYFGAKNIVVNQGDPLTKPPVAEGVSVVSFGGTADFKRFSTATVDEELWFTDGLQPLIPVREIKLSGKHNIENALAAIAIAKAADIPMISILEALRSFNGLPHRCQWIATYQGVDFFNDSKGTNVGATIAAIQGLDRTPNKLVVIMGGEGKGADFSALGAACVSVVSAVVLIGADAKLIAAMLSGVVDTYFEGTMLAAVQTAFLMAGTGDAVVLSPACASFDMFESYQDRGNVFCSAVKEVCCE